MTDARNENIMQDGVSRVDDTAKKIAKVLVKGHVSISAMRNIFKEACKLLTVQSVTQASSENANCPDLDIVKKVAELLCENPTTVDDVVHILQRTGNHMSVTRYPPRLRPPPQILHPCPWRYLRHCQRRLVVAPAVPRLGIEFALRSNTCTRFLTRL